MASSPARWRTLWLTLVYCSFPPWFACAASQIEIEVDFARTNGVLRPLHGINKGPLAPGGLIDLTEQHRELGIPFTRLHDCHWPNPDVVDIHAVFPDFNADPERPESYDFSLTDEYLTAVRKSGAKIVYRLGESIEHTTKKRFVHPPKDPAKWAAICLGIIRHYNEGWAGGARHDIRYWEIWNEPENRPAMWTGTDEEFLTLYITTSRAIKSRYPALKIGGPGFGYSGRFVNGRFQPSEFVTNFLARCRSEGVPLDFFSWHCYTDDPAELVARAGAIRALLDASGFEGAESHLNEWNYLPGKSWKPLSKSSPALERQRFYLEMAGMPGASFVVASLLELQDAPLDMANLFHGELGGFGLFSEHGVPMKNYHGLRAFRRMLATPVRAQIAQPRGDQISVVAGLSEDRSSCAVLVSNRERSRGVHQLRLRNLPWHGSTVANVRVIDSNHDLERVLSSTNQPGSMFIKLELELPGIALLELQPLE